MDKSDIAHIETSSESNLESQDSPLGAGGGLRLLHGDKVTLIPTPSADPRGVIAISPVRKNCYQTDLLSRPLKPFAVAKMDAYYTGGCL